MPNDDGPSEEKFASLQTNRRLMKRQGFALFGRLPLNQNCLRREGEKARRVFEKFEKERKEQTRRKEEEIEEKTKEGRVEDRGGKRGR